MREKMVRNMIRKNYILILFVFFLFINLSPLVLSRDNIKSYQDEFRYTTYSEIEDDYDFIFLIGKLNYYEENNSTIKFTINNAIFISFSYTSIDNMEFKFIITSRSIGFTLIDFKFYGIRASNFICGVFLDLN